MTHAPILRAPVAARPAPVRKDGIMAGLKARYFPTPLQGVATVVLGALLIWLLPRVVDWALVRAVWSPADPAACAAATAGACWAVVAEKYRVMFFGTFPYDEQWRAALACVVILAATVLSAVPRFWSVWLCAVWAAAFALTLWLMLGGAGLSATSTSDWGGLPLTLLLFAGTVSLGLPLALGLALGRDSAMPAFRYVCIATIELFRGLPLLAVLFMASLMLPLFLGDGITIDKFVRALVGMTLFFGAYAAEIVRGGLQALGKGQYEGARALGLSYWPMMGLVILPQALKIVAPALVNDIIRAFKNTSFVAIIGLFDFLGATKAALEDPLWIRYALEAYLFLMLVYFAFCFVMSRYALWIERRLDTDVRRPAP
ncbi:amino acid ABC transporter permease [Acuticoccus sp. MNP-M23]|uniref:amino acid ABC transporter permease n=1 Tax=Acuticoccus sp. MNP-M23 TaxID=3072793 RepID=UPI0028156F53|nr:amino acid ABC transporter permease [Acuticoccus sp. MNP-M23]WMS44318.1 amino acid ABC transporter permease [Acuticoccus sp. MNP-M23]